MCSSDLTGNAFAMRYYSEHGLYLLDYQAEFHTYLYKTPESQHDFDLFSSMLDKRLKGGVLTQSELRSQPRGYSHTRAPR